MVPVINCKKSGHWIGSYIPGLLSLEAGLYHLDDLEVTTSDPEYPIPSWTTVVETQHLTSRGCGPFDSASWRLST